MIIDGRDGVERVDDDDDDVNPSSTLMYLIIDVHLYIPSMSIPPARGCN